MSSPTSSSPSRLSDVRKAITPALVLAVVALLAYGNSFKGAFVFDDISSIVENPSIRDLSQVSEVLSPPTAGGATVGGRPILNLSLALNYAISGDQAWSYHAVNLFIHYLAGLTLFGLIRRSFILSANTATPSPHAVELGKNAFLLSFIISGVWLVHPLQTESVTYVVQRAESLMGLFFLLTLYGFLRASTSPHPTIWWSASFLFCLLGCGTKEVTALAPIIILLFDRSFISGSFREAWRRHRGAYLALATTWLALAWLLASTGGNRGGTIGFDIGISWWAYWLTQFEAIVRYLGLSFWPHPLVFDYGQIPAQPITSMLHWVFAFLLILTGVAFAAWRKPKVSFLVAWIFLLLAPTSLVPGSSQMIVEHRMYLSLAAIIILVFITLTKWCGVRAALFFGVITAIAAIATTRARNTDYSTPETLWTDTVAKKPDNARAHNNLGLIFYQQKRIVDAVFHYRESIRLNPGVAQAHYNLGLALMDSNQFAEAAELFSHAVQILPYYYDAHLNLGRALVQLGRAPEALLHFEEAIRFDPSPSEPHFQSGIALASLGQWPEACEHYAKAIAINPASAETHSNWGVALFQMNLPEAAIEHFKASLLLKPELADIHFNLGLALASLGRNPEALSHFEATLKFKPGFQPAEEMLQKLRLDTSR